MTPKEKAKTLIAKYLTVGYGVIQEYVPVPMPLAKQCALIAIREVIDYSKAHGFIELTDYYLEVEQEIENL